MKKDKLSVVVPVFNIERYVENCICSIQNQNYAEIEIIIIDDGSTDHSGQICEELAYRDKRIKVVHQENMGVMVARIRGIEEATGKWIAFVDGDDFIEKDMYSAMIDGVKDCEMITCGVCREEQESTRDVVDDFEDGIYTGHALWELMSKAIYDFDIDKVQRLTPWLINKVYITKYMKEVASECMDRQIAYAEDSVMLYRYLLKCKSVQIGKKVYYTYRYRDDSAIHSRKDDILTDINKVYLSLKDRFENTDKKLKLEAQLQKWIICLIGYAFNHQMGFREDICPIEFLIDGSVLRADRVAIYGAGKCGRDFYKQMELSGKKPTIWVDKGYQKYKEQGCSVDRPEKLAENDFDMVLIAVSKADLVNEIVNDLVDMGVQKEKIFWRKPVRVF